MKKALSILIYLIGIGTSIAQTPFSERQLKEHYDFVYAKKMFSSSSNCTGIGAMEYMKNCQGGIGSTYGDNLGPGLESLIQLFRLTNDNAYLFRFIELAFTSINARITYKTGPYVLHHYADLGGEYPGWTDVLTSTNYLDGVAMWPLSHFVYLVKSERPSLQNLTIPANTISNLPSGVTTVGAVSDQLSTAVLETLLPHLQNYWDDAKGFKQNPTTNSDPSQINQQSLMGLPLLYMAKALNNTGLATDLMTKSKLLAEQYRRVLHLEDRCLGSCAIPFDENIGVIEDMSNESVFWFSNGWRVPEHFAFSLDADCFCPTSSDDINEYKFLVEDISHAANVLFFVEAGFDLGLTTTSGAPFMTTTDMIKFRNMFTKNIAVPNSINHPKTYNFKNCTNGTNCDLGPEGDCSSTTGENCFLKEVTAYMPLYKFDNPPAGSSSLTVSTPNVYDIIMETYQNQIMADLGNLHGAGVTLYGLAEIVRAQWDKECENLTLYNRDLTYNQNFSADHNLVINPLLSDDNHSIGQVAYALPTFSEDKFIIRSGVTSFLVAGNFISLEGEVEFEAGSEVEITTITNNCFTGGRYAGQPNDINPEITFSEPSVEIPNNSSAIDNMIPSPKVFPNPSKENCTVRIFNPGEWSLRIHDVSGKLIYEENGNSNDLLHDINISTNTWDQGIYLCKVISNNKENNSKLIVAGNK